MSEKKILNCPLCGGKASIEHDYDYASHPWYYVECDKCGCKTEAHVDENGKEQAIKEWNTRKPMERIVERLEYINKITFDLAKLNWSEYQVGVLNGVASSINKSLEIIKEEGGLND